MTGHSRRSGTNIVRARTFSFLRLILWPNTASPATLRHRWLWAALLFVSPGLAAAALLAGVVGAKNSKVYHTRPAECTAALRINTESMVHFASAEEAEQAGRRLCKTCAGIERRQKENPEDSGEKPGKPTKPKLADDDSKNKRSGNKDNAPPTEGAPLPEFAKVVAVLSGGTLELDIGDKVALLGIVGSPEGGPLAEETARFLKEQTQGRQVKLSRDARPDSVSPYDEWGRLRVYLTPGPDGRDLGGELIFQGYAWLDRAADFERRAEYSRREEEAWQARRGIWQALEGAAGKREVATGRHALCYHEATGPCVAHLSGKITMSINEARARRLVPCLRCAAILKKP